MRRRVYRSRLLLALITAVILGPKSRGTHEHTRTLLSLISDYSNLKAHAKHLSHYCVFFLCLETTCPQSCSLATAVIRSSVTTTGT
jgi:hypothetical protein